MQVTRLIGLPADRTKYLLQLGRELTSTEAEQYLTDVAYLREYGRSRELLPIVDHNGTAFIAAEAAITARPYETMLSVDHRAEHTLEANRTLVNFLGGMRLFLDHTETRLSRRYGTASDQYTAFKNATRAAHDSSRSYRVLYNMRNYVQHCGMPIGDIETRSYLTEDGSTIINEIAVEADANALLLDFNDWRFAKPDLEALRPHFRVAPMVHDVMRELRHIDELVAASERGPLDAAADRVLALIEEAAEGHNAGAVAVIVQDGNRTQFGFRAPSARVLESLGRDVSRLGRP